MTQQSTLSKNIEFHINNSKELDIAVGKFPSNLARHTSLVLFFDGKAVLTIDFSASDSNFSSWFSWAHHFIGVCHISSQKVSRAIKSALDVNLFDYEMGIEILCKLGPFTIQDQEQKERMKQILGALQNIEMGKYHAALNNCRHFVRKAVEYLKNEPECSGDKVENFELKMKQIEEEDAKLIAAGKLKIIFYLKRLGGILFAITYYAAYLVSDPSKDNQEAIGDHF